MNKHIHLILAIFLVSFLFVTIQESHTQIVRVLPLGNSITQGYNLSLPDDELIAYRSPLYDLLNSAGYSFDFVGHALNGDAVFSDAEHGGIPGTRDQYVVRLLQDGYDLRWDEQITTGNQPYLDEFPADIILLHIGTNDMIHDEGSDASSVSEILDEIDAWEAANGVEVYVYVARIVNQQPYHAATTEYNDNVEAMVALRGDPTILIVDMEVGAGIDYGVDMQSDGIHMEESGYNKMAQLWFDTLDYYLSSIPDAPTDLLASTVDASTLQLSWTEHSANETGYLVERSFSSGAGFSQIAVLTTNTTSYTDNGLTDGTEYFYRVRAYNDNGSSAYSNESSATTLFTPPLAPSNLTFGPITTSSIQLNWNDNSDNEDGFRISQSSTLNGTYIIVGTVGANVRQFNRTGLSENTEYFFRVTAYNAGGSLSWVAGSETTSQTLPAAPSSLTFAPITNSSIQLNWVDNSSNENGFEIFRATKSNGPYASIALTAANSTSFISTGLNAETRYYYRVTAFNGGGSSSWVSGSATTLPDPPNAPTNLTFSPITNSSIALNWSDNSNDETGFEIFRSTSSGGTYAQVGTTGAGTTTFNNTGLIDNTRYYYRVYAYNTGGLSAALSGSAITLPDVPNAPSNLTFSSITNTSIQLNWTDNSNNEDGFEIFRSLSSGGTFVSVGTTGAGVTTFNNTGLSQDTEYFYRVYAYNSGGASASFVSGSAITQPDVPAAPGNMTFGTITSNSIDVQWLDNSDNEDGFEIFRSLVSWGMFNSVGTTGAGVTSFNSTGLIDNTMYYYRVVAFNSGGSSTYTSGYAVTLPLPPVAPDNLTFSPITNTSIQLNWSDNSNNEDGFEIFRATSFVGPFTSIANTGPGITNYNSMGLTEDTEYFYRVVAFNAGGASTPVSGSAMTLPDPPTAPSNLAFGLITENSIQLAWADNSDNEDGFEIFRSISLGGPYASVGTTGTGINSYNDTGLNDDTEYFYQVYAFNTGGISAPVLGSASTLMQVPDDPSKLDAKATTTCSVDLKWDDKSDNEAGFELERSTSPVGGFSLLQIIEEDIEAYTDISTQNNTTYYYRIRAFNAAGYSDYSNERLVTIAVVLDGGAIGVDESICPNGDPSLIFNVTSPSGGSNNWSYQWQSRVAPALFEDIADATSRSYDPPAGMVETAEFMRISTVECGSVPSNLVTITVEDLEDPVFTYCPRDTIIYIDRDQTGAVVATPDPEVTDNCEIVLQTWTMTGSTIAVSPGTGINNLGSYEFNLGVTTVTYRTVDPIGNFAECSFNITVEYSLPEIQSVSIPDAIMKIGDIISATITVATDGGSEFTMVSGLIGGYPLYNFQRIDETTYLANFEIIEDGNSYLATEDIPVTDLIITDETVQSLAYNLPIIQGNDLLDSRVPVIGSVVAETGIYSIGDVVNLNISADGLNYEIHPSSVINGVLATELNVLFTELGGGIYRLSYMVQEGDTDAAPGELLATVILVKPSGNIGVPYTEIGNTASVSIDAHAPVITHLEVPDLEVGVGGTVQVTITADEAGYVASVGSIINGIPLSSPRITFFEATGGLYEISYVVDAGDAEVAPGELSISMVMTDPSGNTNEPYLLVETNTLEIYTDLPIALLADIPEICEEETVELTVFLEGREPWSFDLYDGSDTTTYEDVVSNVFNITISPLESTTYQILAVRDVNMVENGGSGERFVKVNEKTPVEIINLASGYNYEADPVKLEADVPGGTFSGPGVFSETGYFDPGVADTINSPHTLYYTYVNSNGCESVDSVLVFVLGADGGLYIPSDLVCDNADPFTVNASNISGVTGTFALLNDDGQAVDGLTDNGDNSAEINPALLAPGQYTIEYTYVDLVALYLRRTFVVESIVPPVILNVEDIYCQNTDPFLLQADEDSVVFEGPGVSGTMTTGYVFDPSSVEPGTMTIFCTTTSENGCTASAAKTIEIQFAPVVDFVMSATCVADSGGTVSFDNLTDGKLEVETWSWNFGDPSSGDDNVSDLVAPEHFYSSPGERTVSLIATAYNGCISEKSVVISIGNRVSADFTWLSDCYTDDSGVEFIDQSVSGASTIDSLIWRFKTADGLLMDEIVSSSGNESITYQFGSAGNYLVELVTITDMGCSDSTSAQLSLRETIQLSKEAYSEAFDLNDGGWTIQSNDQTASWSWNIPDFDGFQQVTGDNAWFTQLPGDVIDYHEDSWLQSLCFDFSGIKKPMISMDIMRSFVPERDGAVLQYQVSKNEGWKTVGEIASGIEWYNSSVISNEPGGSSTGWSLDVFNPDQDWVSVAHDLNMVAQVPNVTFRIALGSNGREGIGNQGFAFDNVSITQRTKMTVIEHFTNSSDAASMNADDIIDSFVKENSGDVIDIQYHMNIPGYDPMNENSPLSSSVRSFNYGIPSVPYAVLNGGVVEEDRFDFSELKSTLEIDQVMQLSLQKPVFDVDLEVNWMEGGLEATTMVTCDVDRYDDNIQLYVVVFETSVTQYTGENGDSEFRNVVLDMLPTPAGKLLGDNWRLGYDEIRENDWTYLPFVEDTDDLGVVAFVLNRNTNEILQAATSYKTPQVGTKRTAAMVESLFIYPNPARNVVNVNLGRPAQQDGRLEIIDMNGRVVHNENVPKGYQIYQVEVSSLNRGIYMIQWYEGGTLKGRNKLITVD